MIPTGAMAAAKFSGGINSYHSLYFFIAASAMAVGRRAQDAIGKSAERLWRRLLLGSLAIVATIGIFNVVTLHPLRLTPDLRAEQTLALARGQPGAPLSAMVSFGRPANGEKTLRVRRRRV